MHEEVVYEGLDPSIRHYLYSARQENYNSSDFLLPARLHPEATFLEPEPSKTVHVSQKRCDFDVTWVRFLKSQLFYKKQEHVMKVQFFKSRLGDLKW